MIQSNETILDLLRHGEVTSKNRFCGSSDVALTPHGQHQMSTTLKANHANWAQIISSPLIRCADVAQAYSSEYKFPLHIDPDLREMDFGAWEGQTSKEIYEQAPEALEQFWQDPMTHSPPQGEAFSVFRARVLNALTEHTRKHAGGQLLFITHGGVIRIILAHVLNMPMDALLRLEVPYSAFSRVRIYHNDDGSYHTSLISHNAHQ